MVNEYFRAAIGAADVVWAFAGVRALYDDGAGKPQDIGRDYALALDEEPGEAPLLTVYGGKLTTYRRLAEAALARLARLLPARAAVDGEDARCRAAISSTTACRHWSQRTQRQWPFLTDDHAQRLAGAYGTRVENVLGNATPARRSRLALRRRSHRRRGALSDDERMGADCR